MPFKHNATCRHRIGKMKFRVTNWAAYEAGLRRRGSLTLWVSEEALSCWQAAKRTTRGGQPRYCDLAIETALALAMAFGLRLRQTEGLLASVLRLMGLDLAVPDHTTLSRRANKWRSLDKRQGHRIPGKGPVHVLVDSTGLQVCGAGQWLEQEHGARSRRSWRKLHLAVDADSGDIIAHVMTDQDGADAAQLLPLLDQIDRDAIGQFTADGAYDGHPTYEAVHRHSAAAAVVVPPRTNAIETGTAGQRGQHVAATRTSGRMRWQAATGYGKRALVETAIGRYKSLIGPKLRARSFGAQQTEVAIGCTVLKRMLACARPNSVRRTTATA